jgi:hypothetical protein
LPIHQILQLSIEKSLVDDSTNNECFLSVEDLLLGAGVVLIVLLTTVLIGSWLH